jgi:COP9 signalosome complex subunit 1
MLNMCMNVVRVSLELENWSYVTSYASKAEQIAPHDTHTHSASAQQTNTQTHDRHAFTHLRIAQTLAALAARNYRQAARHGIDIPSSFATPTTTTTTTGTAATSSLPFADIIAPQDIAAITALCALATFDRNDLKKKVIDSPSFRTFLDLYTEVRDLLSDFYNSRYASCFKLLEKIKVNKNNKKKRRGKICFLK